MKGFNENPKEVTQHPFSAITLRNQTESPLLKLPGEIRNLIYEYLFGGNLITTPQGVNIHVTQRSRYYGKTIGSLENFLLPSLACRQIRSETQFFTGLFLFKANAFWVSCPWRLQSWLQKKSPEQCAAIRTLVLECTPLFDHVYQGFVLPYGTHSLLNDLKGLKHIIIWGARSRRDDPLVKHLEERDITVELDKHPWIYESLFQEFVKDIIPSGRASGDLTVSMN